MLHTKTLCDNSALIPVRNQYVILHIHLNLNMLMLLLILPEVDTAAEADDLECVCNKTMVTWNSHSSRRSMQQILNDL